MSGTPSLLVGVLAGVAAGNPARRAVPLLGRVGRTRLAVALGLVALALAAIDLLADPIVELLDADAATVRIAAGLVLAVTALLGVVAADPRPLPRRARLDRDHCAAGPLPGLELPGGWLVPLAFPHVLRPELALVVLSVGADHGAAGLVAIGAALAPVLLLAGCPIGAARLLVEAGRATAALGVLVGVDLVVGGVFAL